MKNKLKVNGTVIICDNCDVAPEVTFQTADIKSGKNADVLVKAKIIRSWFVRQMDWWTCDNSWQHTNR